MDLFKPMFKPAVALSLLLASAGSIAQEEPNQEETYNRQGDSQWSINIESVAIDSQAAREAFIDSKAFAMNFEWEYFNTHNLVTSIGLGFIQYDDNAGFSQETENVWSGDRQNSSSDASAMPIYVEFGHKSSHGAQDNFFLSAEAGFAIITGSERSIPNCSNCSSFDIDISGGLYGNFAAGVIASDVFSLGLHYKHYFSGDLKSAVGMDFIFHF